MVRGKLNIREERENSLLIDALKPLSAAQTTVFLKFDVLTEQAMAQAASFLKRFPGPVPVVLFDAAKRISKAAPAALSVDPTETFRQEAERIFGKDHVVIK